MLMYRMLLGCESAIRLCGEACTMSAPGQGAKKRKELWKIRRQKFISAIRRISVVAVAEALEERPARS